METKLTFLFAGGGTGGHLFPGISVAQELQKRKPATRSIFVGSTREIESTIVAMRRDGGWQVLRPGPISATQISAVLGGTGGAASDSAQIEVRIEAPGQLASHYAPGKPLRLGASAAAPDEFMIGFAATPGDITLSPSGDLSEAAARLYECLHLAAAAPQPRIAVAAIPMRGIGAAINDRLARAAA